MVITLLETKYNRQMATLIKRIPFHHYNTEFTICDAPARRRTFETKKFVM